ncbi:MAG: DMT family transporter [Gammaproteobacteria bacterium]|nr:DMT family transporter [Gammaproteobacteria bacterium]
MSTRAHSLTPPRSGPLASNLACFTAMMIWSFAFPIAEVLIETWGAVAVVLYRLLIGVAFLLLVWLWREGIDTLRRADWSRGIGVGGIGFGVGSILFLVGQAMADAVTPAIAAAMMPIVGAVLEVLLDRRRLTPRLSLGICLALAGGLLATGTRFGEGRFGWGSLLCLLSVVLFAWGTRATTRNFPSLSAVGQTSVTLLGALVVVFVIYLAMLVAGMPGTAIGSLDRLNLGLLVFSSVASLALAQFLWIRGAAGLGILLASFHMNAVPFYVMLIVVLLLGADWSWWQAGGAALVMLGVLVAQAKRGGG